MRDAAMKNATLDRIEDCVKCQICKDFLTAPVITACSHTFCSLCIRRHLVKEERCPLCRNQTLEVHLRKNIVVEDVTTFVTSLRQQEIDKRPQMADADYDESISATANEPKPEKTNFVKCPCCAKQVSESKVNLHLDKCLEGDSTKFLEKHCASEKPKHTIQNFVRLPKINYATMSEHQLRQQLENLGISSQGSKAEMQKRHMEWLALWNANIDSKSPKPKNELVRELLNWEKSIISNLVQTEKSEMKRKIGDRDHPSIEYDQTYESAFHSEFIQLIRQAKKTKEKLKSLQN